MKPNYAVYEIYDEHIDGLLALRTRILSKDATASVDEIDAILATVERNDVDLALGKLNATLPDCYDAVAVQVVTALERASIVNQSELDPRVILDIEQRCAETSRAEDYDSLTETY